MYARFLVCAALTASWLACPFGIRAAEPAPSGPAVGKNIPGSFSPLVINGAWKDVNEKPIDRHHSLVVDFGLKPVVLVFSRSFTDDATFSFLKKLDARVDVHKESHLKGGLVFLSFDSKRTKGEIDAKELLTLARDKEEMLAQLKDKIQGLKALVVGITSPDGPSAWGLSKKADITIVLYDKLIVKNVIAKEKGELDEKNVAGILAAVDKFVADTKKKPEPVGK
jgi:hypothetical protein